MTGRIKKALARIWPARGREEISPAQELGLKFREFKYLLRSNNEVLNIIADLEEHLAEPGGVGTDFLRSRYIAASAKVFKMIRHLNQISGGRYGELYPAFDSIRHRIDDFLSRGAAMGDDVLALSLDEVEAGLDHLAGSKAVGLALVRKAGLATSPGFVVTTEAFRRFMAEAGLGGWLRERLMILEEEESSGSLMRLSREVMEKVAQTPLPKGLERDLTQACGGLMERREEGTLLSFRSSAIGEDTDASHAGLYTSILGVGPGEWADAYRRVVASLYSPPALVYRRRRGLMDTDAEMAVLVQIMLRPRAAGVMYTTDPLVGRRGRLIVSAVYGLGAGLVDGSMDPDVYRVERGDPPRLADSEVRVKTSFLTLGPSGPREEAVSPELAAVSVLSEKSAVGLAGMGLTLEREMGGPQDVEWAQTTEGELIILQSRALRVNPAQERRGGGKVKAPVLISGGKTAQPGAGSGPVFLVESESDLAAFPSGAVMVARRSSPSLASALCRAAAVVTEVGGVTGHMASLAREFGVPSLLGLPGARAALSPGRLVTVDAGAGVVYEGRVDSLLEARRDTGKVQREAGPRPGWHGAAQLITRLNLTDPHAPDFKPAGCTTFHDLIRFMHEMSFKEMFLLGDRVGAEAGGARRVGHKLPFELWMIDLGGGIREDSAGAVMLDDLASAPARAFMEGLTDSSVRWDQPRPVSWKGLASVMSGALLNPPADGKVRDMGQKAYAIISADYLNFNCRVGYHFSALDSYCSAVDNDNYVSFRMSGGAATTDRRELRARLVERILKPLGFDVERTGDTLSAFLKKHSRADTARVLVEMGRLVLFTRQMDMLMEGAHMVEYLARAFEEGDYNLEKKGGEEE